MKFRMTPRFWTESWENSEYLLRLKKKKDFERSLLEGRDGELGWTGIACEMLLDVHGKHKWAVGYKDTTETEFNRNSRLKIFV